MRTRLPVDSEVRETATAVAGNSGVASVASHSNVVEGVNKQSRYRTMRYNGKETQCWRDIE